MTHTRSIAPDRWFTLPIGDTRKCVRCGWERRIKDSGSVSPICADCILVCRDLGELDLWTGRAA